MLNLFSYDFMQRAFLAVIAMSLFSPILGTFLILRRQSLMSDTLSHVSLAGVAFGLVLGLSPTLTTVIVVMISLLFLLNRLMFHWLIITQLKKESNKKLN